MEVKLSHDRPEQVLRASAHISDTRFFCYRLSRPQGHRTAGRIKSIKNPNNLTGKITRNLPAFN